MKAWSHLPNAHHIDWVIKSAKENPKLWSESWSVSLYFAKENLDVLEAARDAAWTMVDWTSRNSELDAANDEAWNAIKGVAAYAAAGFAILTLIAYDDCDQHINMGYEKLYCYATLSENPPAILLLPMVYVRERLSEQIW